MDSASEIRRVWLTRGGHIGEHERFALTVGTTGGGWRGVPDLTAASDRSFIKSVLAEVRPDVTPGCINSWAGQLFALVNTMSEGDYVIMPLKGQEVVAVGEITRAVTYLILNARLAASITDG